MKKILALLLMLVLACSVSLSLAACSGGNDDDGDLGDAGNSDNGSGTDGDGGNSSDGGNGDSSSGSTDGGLACTHVDADDDGVCDKAGCGEQYDDGAVYRASIHTVGGMPVESVMVFLWSEGVGMIQRGETDYNGEVEFSVPLGSYTLEIDELPLGYEAEDRYALAAGMNEIEIATAPYAGDVSEVDRFYVGDVIPDMTLVDIEGKSHTFSEILGEKELLVLNFWYVGCKFCEKEFPYLASAYDKYSDRVEVLAINDFPSNTLSQVESFVAKDENGNTVELNFPKIFLEESIITRFSTGGYPVTVCIDRYGVISIIHTSGILDEEIFTDMFDGFLGEDYKQNG